MNWITTHASVEEGRKSGEIQLLLKDTDKVSQEYKSSIAHVKRFLERWTADPDFRKRTKYEAVAVTKEYGLEADPNEIRLLWDSGALAEHLKKKDQAVPLVVRRYESFIQEKLAYRDVLRTQLHPSHPKFKNWRSRHINRSFSELGIYKAHGIVHAPVVFEISQGCSVGCWFCGVAAQKLKENFEYTPENAALWQGVLKGTYQLLGPAAGKGFCYWASDPLDIDISIYGISC